MLLRMAYCARFLFFLSSNPLTLAFRPEWPISWSLWRDFSIHFKLPMSILASTLRPVEGPIIPPPEIRKVVDKTAAFVAKHGAAFEERIKAKQGSDPKFGFLNATDHYHAYYKQMIEEYKVNPPDAATANGTAPPAPAGRWLIASYSSSPLSSLSTCSPHSSCPCSRY